MKGIYNGILKRELDIMASAAGLVLLSPLYLLLAIVVRFTSPGEIIFRQERIGKNGKPFIIYKFRSMYSNAEKNGPQLSNPNDTRITSSGKWMRRYRFDELPQLWNVLKGDMSFVGPRPERMVYINEILKELPDYTKLWEVMPGLTSMGVIKNGYAKNVTEMVKRSRYDLEYLDHRGFLDDFLILKKTLKILLLGRGM